MVMTKNLTFPRASGKGPTMSIPNLLKGHGLDMLVNGATGMFCIGANVWHSLRHFMIFVSSL